MANEARSTIVLLTGGVIDSNESVTDIERRISLAGASPFVLVVDALDQNHWVNINHVVEIRATEDGPAD
jgi:hypothetical protein